MIYKFITITLITFFFVFKNAEILAGGFAKYAFWKDYAAIITLSVEGYYSKDEFDTKLSELSAKKIDKIENEMTLTINSLTIDYGKQTVSGSVTATGGTPKCYMILLSTNGYDIDENGPLTEEPCVADITANNRIAYNKKEGTYKVKIKAFDSSGKSSKLSSEITVIYKPELTFTANYLGAESSSFQGIASGIYQDPTGDIWATFSRSTLPNMIKFSTSDPEGTITSITGHGSGVGELNTPMDIVASEDGGLIWVADRYNNRVIYFDPADIMGTFTSVGGASMAGRMHYASNGEIWIGRIGNWDIRYYDTNSMTWGSNYGNSIIFYYPHGAAYHTTTQTVYVGDHYNKRVAYFPRNDFSKFKVLPLPSSSYNRIVPDVSDDVWILGSNEIYRFNPSQYDSSFRVIKPCDETCSGLKETGQFSIKRATDMWVSGTKYGFSHYIINKDIVTFTP